MKQVNQRLAYGKGWENTPIPLLRRGGRQFPSRKRGMNTPTLSLPPRRGRMKVGGEEIQNQPPRIERG